MDFEAEINTLKAKVVVLECKLDTTEDQIAKNAIRMEIGVFRSEIGGLYKRTATAQQLQHQGIAAALAPPVIINANTIATITGNLN